MDIGYIYKIVNNVNDKIYIGQTRTTIELRWKKHINRFKNEGCRRGIYGAFAKYGLEHFYIEELCSCSVTDLDDLEIFYINKYNTYNNGYNLTIGGQNGSFSSSITEQEVIEKYNELGYVNQTADYFECSARTISNILNKNQINIIKHGQQNLRNNGNGTNIPQFTQKQKIRVIEHNLEFPSLLACGEWMVNNKLCQTNNPEYAMKSISRVLNGDRQTYCKLHFERLGELYKTPI